MTDKEIENMFDTIHMQLGKIILIVEQLSKNQSMIIDRINRK